MCRRAKGDTLLSVSSTLHSLESRVSCSFKTTGQQTDNSSRLDWHQLSARPSMSPMFRQPPISRSPLGRSASSKRSSARP